MRHSATILVLAATAWLVGCSTTQPSAPTAQAPAQARPAPPAAPAAPAAPTSATAAAPQSRVATVTLPAHLDPKHPISTERSVHFDFDEFVIKAEYQALVDRHGRYLATNPTLSIKVEGHADERGSTEYNLALGQKRAQAVLSALRLLGAREGQMEATSWGEERPRNPGHDEVAWAENRRADIMYPRP